MLLAASIACAPAACGGAEDAPPVAAPPDASDGADAAAPPPEDAGDAADAADAPAPLPEAGACPGVFCDDFEDGALADDWDVLNVSPGASAELESGAFVARTPEVAATETAFSHLRTTHAGTPSRVRVSFDARLPVTSLDQGVLAIATVDVAQNHFFTLFLRDGDPDAPGPSLEETTPAGTTRHVLSSPPPENTWTRIVIDIDLGAGSATVSWDATKALDAAPVEKTPAAAAPTIRVGALYVYGPTAAFEGRFDDVLVEHL